MAVASGSSTNGRRGNDSGSVLCARLSPPRPSTRHTKIPGTSRPRAGIHTYVRPRETGGDRDERLARNVGRRERSVATARKRRCPHRRRKASSECLDRGNDAPLQPALVPRGSKHSAATTRPPKMPCRNATCARHESRSLSAERAIRRLAHAHCDQRGAEDQAAYSTHVRFARRADADAFEHDADSIDAFITPDPAGGERQAIAQARDRCSPAAIPYRLHAPHRRAIEYCRNGRVLEFNEATVKTRLHRAHAKLRVNIARRLRREHLTLFEFGGRTCDRIVAHVLARLSAVYIAPPAVML